RVACAEHDPAGVERVVEVGVIAANIERARYGPRGDVQYHRHAGAGLDWQLLERVKQTLRARRVQHTAAAEGRAVTDARRAVFTVTGHHHDIVLAFGLHLREVLSDLGRGCNRKVAHDVVTDIAGRKCRG